MKKILIILAGIFLLAQNAHASAAEAMFSASSHDRILLVLNNYPINQHPAQKVMLRGRPGVYHVQIRVYNQWGRLKFIHHDRVRIRSGRKNMFILETHPYKGSRLITLSKKAKMKAVAAPAGKRPPIRYLNPGISLINSKMILQPGSSYLQNRTIKLG